MDRRNFLRSMLGVAAATALPSEVFPFRKIFLPMAPRIVAPNISAIEAIELEFFAKQIPFYSLFKNLKRVPMSGRPLRTPLIWTPNEDQAKAIADKYAEGVDVQAAIDAL